MINPVNENPAGKTSYTIKEITKVIIGASPIVSSPIG
jgi:hypothetical protein